LHRRTTAILVAAAVALVACSSDEAADGTSTTAAEPLTTTTAPEVLTILVTDDDGIGAPGIDVLVNALLELDAVEVVVVAPAENQSGSSDKTTPGGATFADGATASGIEGTAVHGFPADTIAVALDELAIEPDLVVSGINEGQNTGPLAFVSGTVGAARAAARRGIPAVAGSAGLGEAADYESATELVIEWIAEHRDELLAGTASTDAVTSFNVPDCTTGERKDDLLEVPLVDAFPEGADPFTSDCSIVPVSAPANDAAALAAGYAALTLVPLDAP
jgi:5'-nucleotidase